eukprot:gene2159-2024_t
MDEDQTIQEFKNLVQRSQTYFLSLRELPISGNDKVWQLYFKKSFEAYTQLWKFQQDYRPILDAKKALKRWEIGEIASKIAQLYYHYYLRTSELSYLEESFTFYSAIEERKYFENLTNEKNLKSIFIKKLRYFLRFILVCILQNKHEKVLNIIEIFKKNLKVFEEINEDVDVENYPLSPTEKNLGDWKLVIKELEKFMNFKNLIHISNEKKLKTKPFNFIESNSISMSIIIGNNDKQIKYSELSLDMFRILHSLERSEKNPKKILLYRPTFSLVLNSLSNSFYEMKKNEILLFYLNSNSNEKSILMRDNEIFAVDDLMPFTRKPVFLIVESKFFDSMIPSKNRFESPFIGLFSNDLNQSIDGVAMMTWFLTNPVEAICYLFEIKNIEQDQYEKIDEILNKLYNEIIILLINLLFIFRF